MRITTFASGSSGNCALVSHGGTNILIDAGISARRIKQCLQSVQLQPQDISSIVITHEHADHINGLQNFLKLCDAPVFAAKSAVAYMRSTFGVMSEKAAFLESGLPIEIGEITLEAFPTPHDTPDSYGYRFSAGNVTFGYATDTGHVNEEMLNGLSGSDAVVIESNHDLQMLKNGPYPSYLKRRILSPRGHLSNDSCGELARTLYDSGTRLFILAHLSRENNVPSAALQAARKAVPFEDAKIYTAPASETLSFALSEECNADH